LHGKGKRNEEGEKNVASVSFKEKAESEDQTSDQSRNRPNNGVDEGYNEPRDPICTVTGSEDVKSCDKIKIYLA
jgi:hypothetical protein